MTDIQYIEYYNFFLNLNFLYKRNLKKILYRLNIIDSFFDRIIRFLGNYSGNVAALIIANSYCTNL